MSPALIDMQQHILRTKLQRPPVAPDILPCWIDSMKGVSER